VCVCVGEMNVTRPRTSSSQKGYLTVAVREDATPFSPSILRQGQVVLENKVRRREMKERRRGRRRAGQTRRTFAAPRLNARRQSGNGCRVAKRLRPQQPRWTQLGCWFNELKCSFWLFLLSSESSLLSVSYWKRGVEGGKDPVSLCDKCDEAMVKASQYQRAQFDATASGLNR